MKNEVKSLDFVSTIPACYAGAISHKLNKIISRANKKGLDGMISYTISDLYIVKKRNHPDTPIVKNKVVDVTVKGEVPKINGWSFIGKLTHDGAGNFVTVLSAPGTKVPTKYRKSTGGCDHCNRARYRKDTFVISKGGKFMEIGRSCLKDFFPTVNIEWVVDYFKYVSDMLDSGEINDYNSFKGIKVNPKASLDFILMVSNAVIRRDGWMSATAANKIMEKNTETYIIPTSSEINHQICLLLGFIRPSKNEIIIKITKKDEEIASKVIDFVRNDMYGNGDYVYNMKNFFSLDEVELRYVPFVASGIAAYNRSVEKIIEMKTKKAVSNYVGTIGEKITADVEVLAAKYVSSYYGSSLLVKMIDDLGNTFTTFYSGYKFEPEVGDNLTIKGTVKAHKEFKGWKSTMLIRVKVV